MQIDDRVPIELRPTSDSNKISVPEPTYIDDGMYIGHDGYQFVLFTLEGMKIALQPSSIEFIKRYMERTALHYSRERERVAEIRIKGSASNNA